MSTSGDRYLRVPAILAQLSKVHYPQTLSQVASRLNLPKATTMRILGALADSGLVVRLPKQRGYVIGPAAARLALGLLQAPRFTQDVRGILANVVTLVGESCNLTALESDHMRYIERVEASHLLRLSMSAGDRVPLHCTASGKLALALMDSEDREALLRHLLLRPYTQTTVIDRGQLLRDLETIRRSRVGTDRGEFVHGMVAVAVPVMDTSGAMIAALACHGPTARISMRDLEAAVPMMRTAAEKLGALLGAETMPQGGSADAQIPRARATST